MRYISVMLLSIFLWSSSHSEINQPPTSQLDEGPGGGRAMTLYRVWVGSRAEAALLKSLGVEPLLKIDKGYLVLAGPDQGKRIVESGLDFESIGGDIDRDRLALDIRNDMANAGRFPIVYEEPGIRLLRVEPRDIQAGSRSPGLAPLLTQNLKIEYHEPSGAGIFDKALDIDMDSLLSRISEDSLIAYTEHLQAYLSLESGHTPNYSAGKWAVSKFLEFGYDSVVVDTFLETIDGRLRQCRNVICYKVGSVYPYDQIIVGAHRDTEVDCPGADDNLSGVAGVLEIARALADVETNLTIIFTLFDAEERGLLGSWHYANRAAMRGDRIVVMSNMDMIGHFENESEGLLICGANTQYGDLWVSLADSIPDIAINGIIGASGGGSDHIPFMQNGYDILHVTEYIHSTVYHTRSDSTVYLSYDYMKRMIMATLASVYTVNAAYVPEPELIFSFQSPSSSVLAPGGPLTVDVFIEEYAGGILVPGTARLYYSINGDEFDSLPMEDLGGGLYRTIIEAITCGNRIRYYAGAEEVIGGTSYFPAPEKPRQGIMATSITVVFEDNFETSKGWSVSGDATDGQWERGPAGEGMDIWTVAQNDYDGSGQCYMTDFDDWHDVDEGTTILLSPPIDVSAGEAFVEYARWYKNDRSWNPNSDEMKIYVYDGPTPYLVETVGPVEQASGGWYTNEFWVCDYVSPSGPIRLRFDASDLGGESEVEAAVDAVKISLYSFSPYIITQSLPDAELDAPYMLQLEASSCHDPISWMDKYGDLAGTGLTLSSDGLLEGVAEDTGHFVVTIVATDNDGLTTEQNFPLRILKYYLCGDANGDEQINVGDAVFIINYVFKGGAAPAPLCAGDANGDGDANVGDAVFLVAHIFLGGSSPVVPCCP